MPDAWDVIVIGAGLAGWSCALAAAEADLSVLVLEKQASPGGSTVLSGGFFAFAGTDMQAECGIEDSAELLLRDLVTVGEGKNDITLLESYVEGQLDLYRWLCAHGAHFSHVESSAGQSVARSHHCDPTQLIGSMRDASLSAGVEARYETAVMRLVRTSGSRVDGVITQNQEGLSARLGVVLATGGFSRSRTMLERFAPRYVDVLAIGGGGSTGDGLRLAGELGAKLRDTEYVKGTFGAHPSSQPERQELLLAFYLGAVIVNREGNRFIDESSGYKAIGDACLEQTGRLAFQVFDARVYSKSVRGVPLFDLESMLERGLLMRGESLEEVAAASGIEPDGLKRTVGAYNASLAKRGYDDAYGRRTLCHTDGVPVPLDLRPFYAFASTTALLATYCGLRVNNRAEVLDPVGKAIPALFAAGEVMGGFHGAGYMTGTSLGKAAHFGRLAGSVLGESK